MFGGEVASDEKSYPHLNFKTVLMICRDLNKCNSFIKRKLGIIEAKNDTVLNYGNY